MRDNPDLDDAFLGAAQDVNRPAKGQRKRKKNPRLTTDQARRYAFRVLGLLAGLEVSQRTQVLAAAERLNRA